MRTALVVRTKFDAAHRLLDYDGPCGQLHGHTYHLEVEVSRADGSVDKATGMVADFGRVKEVLKNLVLSHYDHALILDEDDPMRVEPEAKGEHQNLAVVPGRATAENIAGQIFVVIDQYLTGTVTQHGLHLQRLRLWETEACAAEIKR